MVRIPPYTLLTGATGLVGSFLTRDLLRAGVPVAVLVRPSSKKSAAERVESMLRNWEPLDGTTLSRPVYLVGDVNSPNLGLDSGQQRWLSRHCRRVIHNAAVVRFTGSDQRKDPWKTNFEGTRRTLILCRKLGVREFHYVSTAYVCGRRQGVICESELEKEQGFRNAYEHSKYLAERLVRDDRFIAPPTIYRPVVIAGDSRTGYTNSCHGLNVYVKLLHVLMSITEAEVDGRRYAPLRVALQGDEPRNVVPVNWVSQVICHLLDTPAAHGHTFHLAPQEPITARQFFEAAYRFFDAYGVEFCGRHFMFDSETSVFEEAFLAHRAHYKDYELTDPHFDTANLCRFAGHLPCPVMDEETLHRYFRFAARDRERRRSSRKERVELWAEEILERALGGIPGTTAAQSAPAAQKAWDPQNRMLGLDIRGPGGGQWHLTLGPSGAAALRAGLPLGDAPIVALTVARLARLLRATRPAHRTVTAEGVSTRCRSICVDQRRVRRLFGRLTGHPGGPLQAARRGHRAG